MERKRCLITTRIGSLGKYRTAILSYNNAISKSYYRLPFASFFYFFHHIHEFNQFLTICPGLDCVYQFQ